MNNTILMVVDGGSRGNPGPLYVALYIELTINGNRTTLGPKHYNLGFDGTNNEAEYHAIIYGVESAMSAISGLNMDPTQFDVVVYSDSQLVVRQINGQYKTEATNLLYLKDRASTELAEFSTHIVLWVPRDITYSYLGC